MNGRKEISPLQFQRELGYVVNAVDARHKLLEVQQTPWIDLDRGLDLDIYPYVII